MDQATRAQLKEGVTKSLSIANDLPWNVTSPDELGPVIMRFTNSHEPYFRRWAENWFTTMQYIFGQHNFKWAAKGGFAVDYDDIGRSAGQTSRVRPYTNIARIAVEALCSGLYSNAPTWEVNTTTQESLDGRRQQRIMSKLLTAHFEQGMMDKDVSAGAFAFSVFGQMAWETWYNQLGGRVMKIPRMMPQLGVDQQGMPNFNPIVGGYVNAPVPVLNSQGQPMAGNNVNYVRDASGNVVYDTITPGSTELNVLTPFEYRREVGSSGMHKSKYVQIFRLMDYDDFQDRYGILPGKTKYFGAIQPVTATAMVWEFAFRLFARLQYVTPPSSLDVGARWGGGSIASLMRKVLVVEHFDKPHPIKWPLGRRVIIANGRCTHVGLPDFNTHKLDGWHPLSEAQWNNPYPSSISTGPTQDLVVKNREIDNIDRNMALAVRRQLGSHYLVKVGSGIDPNRLTGEPGVALEVTDPYGIRILHDEMPIAPAAVQYRAQNMTEAYDQSAALESQRGVGIEGSSGYQTQLLQNSEEKRLAPARRAFRSSLAAAGEKQLYCIHRNVLKLDDAVYSYLIQNAEGEFTPSDVVSFLATPLNVGTQIKIEESSMDFKSKAQLKADLAQAMTSNKAIADKIGTDANLFWQYMKLFNIKLRDRSVPHRERAERENEFFVDMLRQGAFPQKQMMPRVLWEDDDTIHEDEHAEFIITYYEQLRNNPELMFAFYVHLEQHRLNKEQKQAQLLMQTSLQAGPITQLSAMQGQVAPSLQQIGMDTQLRQMQEQMLGQTSQQTPKQEMGKLPGAPKGANPKAPGGAASEAAPENSQRAGASRG
jgi:hypothetical protein